MLKMETNCGMSSKMRSTKEPQISYLVLSKKIRKQDRLPWVNKKTRSLLKRRDKVFRTMTNLRSEKSALIFIDLKRKVQREIRKKYNNYVEDLIDPNLDNFWSMVEGIKKRLFPLWTSTHMDDQIISNSKDIKGKCAKLPRNKSVFNEEITNDLLDMGHSPFRTMQIFFITVPGVTKLQDCYMNFQNSSLHRSHLF